MITNGRVLAAVIDCEGCITFSVDGRPRVEIEMVEPQYIAALNSAYPGGRIDSRERPDKPNWRPSYRIRYHGEKARTILQLLAKYSLIKGRQAQIALQALDTPPGERDELIEEMHNLNRLGRRVTAAIQ